LAEFLQSRPEILELLRVPRDRPRWDETGNYRALVGAALRHRAEWLICVDADERLECQFRVRAERVIGRGGLFGLSAYAVGLRELWDHRVLRPEDRLARRRRYEALDPTTQWQPGLGYAHLTDETGLELRSVPPRRDYRV
jgi:hypothetical protein